LSTSHDLAIEVAFDFESKLGTEGFHRYLSALDIAFEDLALQKLSCFPTEHWLKISAAAVGS
jgi:hypothetical protein